ncbi:bifunctional folylpolyglutamate synthase/dihydrofolate synthase [Parasphaerochaeta coccoides]|uniref:Dihydrofolate synthase/folylpolyglutamate synthase n=1 Tax=Parasphaerochaeta coccoides (strain ATCC BAA-1237 / DSM 17374 / SPN1) TaxID=760011 RepID=F4GI11_PARC1|nr:Mur ligase family protein [Parasphaerochaeta coccoides]AEC02124.1 FolC bifunctional protein [Parasphaerochaeta coccoides DSM 17374]
MSFTTFENVVSWLDGQMNLEKLTTGYTKRTYRLDRMHALLDHLGHPEATFKSIHVAGSKGKGSTAAFIASGLSALGHRTGLYMSPHVSDYRERFTRAGQFFPDAEIIAAADALHEAIQDFHFSDQWGSEAPTTFELYTSLAYMLFARSGCSWAVIETGLGGRLDATNTLMPEAAVLCPIELEHTSILGSTLSQIAIEKSKIIMPGRPVFVSFQSQEAMDVFTAEAHAQGSDMTTLARETSCISAKTTKEGELVDITWKDGQLTRMRLSMMGEVQAENCALALLVLKKLGQYQAGKTEAALETCLLPGRFQVLAGCGTPLYIDGAHTVNSLTRLMHSFKEIHDETKTTVIYGALLDKDHDHMTRIILETAHTIIVSTPGHFKKSDPDALYATFRKNAQDMGRDSDILLIKDARDALEEAFRITPQDGAILSCGSFYLAGDIRQAYDGLMESMEKGRETACP